MSARVLVVDDLEVNRKLLEAKLASEYYDVRMATGGEAALTTVKSDPPDIILLDIMMPQMDGFEVCRRLKADPQTADIPIVMVTALSDVSDRLRGLEVGADDFLTKPVNDTVLFARVRSLVRLKRTMEEWRLREEVYGRFALKAGVNVPVAEDAGPARILVLENVPAAAKRLAEHLAPLASDVIETSDCSAALDALDGSIELFIASLSMVGDDPLRLVSRLRASETTRQVPILLIAEDGELPRLAKGLDLGANDYLIRPIERNELLARVRTQIRRKRLHDRLRENYQRSLNLALTDDLTGLYNRRYLAAHLDGLMARLAEGGSGPAALMFDIDHFKRINDTYGHPAGDAVLREVASRVQHNLRNFDVVARYGGEEFVVVMPETTLQTAAMVAERLRTAIGNVPFRIAGVDREIPVTISIGVAVAATPSDSAAALLKRADDALFVAKRNGRNQVVTWTAPPLQQATGR